MGCIETFTASYDTYLQAEINSNMGCIETAQWEVYKIALKRLIVIWDVLKP